MAIENYPDAVEIAAVGEGFLIRSWPADRFHHREHLITMVYLLREYPTRDWRVELPGLIRSYNVAAGGVNDETRGYHHTITMAFISIVEAIVSRVKGDLTRACRAVLGSQAAMQDVLLQFWSRERLFSVEARRGWVEPDLHPLNVDAMAIAATAT